MSILNGTQAETPAANPWAGKVRVQGVCAPWWNTTAVAGVAEVQIAGVFSLLVHVTRSAKSGRLFASMPSTKRDGEWTPVITIDDAQLGKAITAAAVAAVQGWELENGAPAEDDNATPF